MVFQLAHTFFGLIYGWELPENASNEVQIETPPCATSEEKKLYRATCGVDALSKRILLFHDNTCKQDTLGVYVGSNESIPDSITDLLEQPQSSGLETCHIGVATWHNFDIIALNRAHRCIIFDINSDNKIFIDTTLEVLKQSDDRFSFVSRFSLLIPSRLSKLQVNFHLFNQADASKFFNSLLYQKLNNSEESTMDLEDGLIEIKYCLRNPQSWLFSDTRYDRIRDIALKGKICALSQSIIKTEVFTKIGKLLKDNNILVRSVYISNIPSYFDENSSEFTSLCNSVLSISDRDSKILFGDHDLVRSVVNKETLENDPGILTRGRTHPKGVTFKPLGA